MKSIRDINKQIGTLTETDQAKIREVSKELENFTQKKAISQEGLKTLYNIQNRLQLYTEQYSDRLLNLLRQNHMIR